MLAAFQVLVLSVTIRSLYGVVRMPSAEMRLLNGNCGVLGATFLGVLFKAYGDVYEQSGEVLRLPRKMAFIEAKWFKCFQRSCWPLKFEIAGFYFADIGMSLTMGSFVAQNVANMLLLGA